MRILLAASLAFVSAASLAQSYQEGVLSAPSSTAPKVTAETKVKVWSGHQTTRAEIGSHLILVVNDSSNNPGFQLLDRTNSQLVTVTSDAASLQQLASWEGAIFPLLPAHAGFASTWSDFLQQVSDLANVPVARVVSRVSKTSGLESVEYNSIIFGGKVSWDFDSDSHQMVSWYFTPRSGHTRSLHLGSGTVVTPYQRLSYGSDSDNGFSKVMYSQQTSLRLVNGQLVVNSGFFTSVDQALSWLNARTAYTLE
ncbi:MAG TPA: hypothetical protein VGL56_04625 [Fimbriimonadaceae bacterium]|jgi:hypothetical protein